MAIPPFPNFDLLVFEVGVGLLDMFHRPFLGLCLGHPISTAKESHKRKKETESRCEPESTRPSNRWLFRAFGRHGFVLFSNFPQQTTHLTGGRHFKGKEDC